MKKLLLFIIIIMFVCNAIAGEDIQILSEPGIAILINGDYKGKTNKEEKGMLIKNLQPGSYVIDAFKDGFQPLKKAVSLNAGQSIELKIDISSAKITVNNAVSRQTATLIPEVGSLLLKSSPMNAMIKLDGKEVGKTNQKMDNVRVGKHKIAFILRGPYDNIIEYGFNLAPNKTITLNADFDENKVHDSLKEEFEKIFTNSIGIKFILITPKNFIMGSDSKEKFRKEDEISHEVKFTSSFYMQTTEVTQGQWKSIMDNNPSMFAKYGDKYPVENVSWDDVQEFIQKLNQKEGIDKYRLPTEAEWEYCCRAGTNTRFFFGDDEKKLDQYVWYRNNSENKTHQVAFKKPNEFGLYDMLGNVSEWCDDWYDLYPYNLTIDPKGILRETGKTQRAKVFRGEKFNSIPSDISCSKRNYAPSGLRLHYIGFRLVKAL